MTNMKLNFLGDNCSWRKNSPVIFLLISFFKFCFDTNKFAEGRLKSISDEKVPPEGSLDSKSIIKYFPPDDQLTLR